MDQVYNRFFNTNDQVTKTKAIQEWLALNGHGVVIDGIFGPATKQALKDFQTAQHLKATGEPDNDTLNRLIEPMLVALQPIPHRWGSIGRIGGGLCEATFDSPSPGSWGAKYGAVGALVYVWQSRP